jgi:hypothetical protein
MVAVDGCSKTLFVHRVQHSESRADTEALGDYNSWTHEDYMQLATSRWKRMAGFIDLVKDCSDPEAVKALVRLAYEVRRSDTFRSLLEGLFQHRQHHVSRVLDKVGKIAKFFRSAVTLTRVAAKTRLGSIKVEIVPSISRRIDVLRGLTVADMIGRAPALSGKLASHTVEVRRLIQRWRKYIVHAEMLLLIFYEEHPQIALATNYIGISKRSCYLCANFLRIHGVFTVEGQHQQLYCLWTLPMMIKFGSLMQSARFSRALIELHRLLEAKVAVVSQPSYRPLTFLKESVANFSRATMVARAESLEKLHRVVEAEELTTSHTSLPSVVEGETEIKEPLRIELPHAELCRQVGVDQIQTCYKEANQGNASAISPPVVTVKRSSYLESDSSEDRHRTHLQTGNQRRRPKAKTGNIARRVRRRRVSKTIVPQRSQRSARRKKGKHVRSRDIRGFHSRKPVQAQHQKRVSHQGHEDFSVGCSSLVISCLQSIRDFMLVAFGGRDRLQKRSQRR